DYFEEGTDVMSTQGVNLILEARKALTYEPVDADLFNLRLISAFMAWQEAWHGAHDAGVKTAHNHLKLLATIFKALYCHINVIENKKLSAEINNCHRILVPYMKKFKAKNVASIRLRTSYTNRN